MYIVIDKIAIVAISYYFMNGVQHQLTSRIHKSISRTSLTELDILDFTTF